MRSSREGGEDGEDSAAVDAASGVAGLFVPSATNEALSD